MKVGAFLMNVGGGKRCCHNSIIFFVIMLHLRAVKINKKLAVLKTQNSIANYGN